jgi:hypothetical protein
MALRLCLSGLCAAAVATLALASAPAEAAAKRRVLARDPVVTRQVAVNRARTRVTVQPRSFLDGGTELTPGDRKFDNYAFPPGYSPTGVIDNKGPFHRSPLPGPFDLPGFYPW